MIYNPPHDVSRKLHGRQRLERRLGEVEAALTQLRTTDPRRVPLEGERWGLQRDLAASPPVLGYLRNAARILGYAVLFDMPYSFAGKTETVRRGAFRQYLASRPEVVALIDHVRTKEVAATGDHTLAICEDEMGLRVLSSIDLDEPLGQQLVDALRKRGCLGMSVGMVGEESTAQGMTTRIIDRALFTEVSWMIADRAVNPAACCILLSEPLTWPSNQLDGPQAATLRELKEMAGSLNVKPTPSVANKNYQGGSKSLGGSA